MRQPEKQFDTCIRLLRDAGEKGELKIDSLTVTEATEYRTIEVWFGKKVAIVQETDENWSNMFGLLNLYIGSKRYGLQSAVNVVCLLQDQIK